MRLKLNEPQLAVGLERQRAGEAFEEHDAQRVQVGAVVDLFRAERLLRSHVVRRAHHHAARVSPSFALLERKMPKSSSVPVPSGPTKMLPALMSR